MKIFRYLKSKKQAYTELFNQTMQDTMIEGPGEAFEKNALQGGEK